MRGLKGKNVVVTGGASGIGQATAARFLEEGCAVCVLDSSAEARSRVREELPGLAGIIDADVSDLDQVRAAFNEAIGLMGSVDIVINNAGISIRHDFLDITPGGVGPGAGRQPQGCLSTWRKPPRGTWWKRAAA